MSTIVRAIKRLEYANFLIKKKATGDLETFSKKMKLSKSATRDIISQMRDMGALIEFDRVRKSYYYLERGEFCISKFLKYGQPLHRDDTSCIGRPEELCFSETAIFILCQEA